MKHELFGSVLTHHGILGQKWGKRNGPPYPLKGGDYSEKEIHRVYQERKKKNSIYNKKHFDKVIKEGTVLSTLSYDQNRTKDAEMFYAAYEKFDKHQYNAMFNRPVSEISEDKNGHITTKSVLKYRIENKAMKDINVASEDSSADVFSNLYKSNRDFYNFVSDPNRMQSLFVKDKYKFRGYRESRKSLDKLRSGGQMNKDDVKRIYRMFNYVIPSDGNGNARAAKDVANQRAKFFKALSDSGYGALLDTNDAIYGGFKATAPVIVFNTHDVAMVGASRTTTSSKRFSEMVTAGRKILGR